jgi:hypothetical protein
MLVVSARTIPVRISKTTALLHRSFDASNGAECCLDVSFDAPLREEEQQPPTAGTGMFFVSTPYGEENVIPEMVVVQLSP